MNSRVQTHEQAIAAQFFAGRGIPVENITVRNFPGETIVVVEVLEEYFDKAIRVASDLDEKIENGFVTVRKIGLRASNKVGAVRSLQDARITTLIELLNARSRTSEQQPSLHYVKDAVENLSIAVTPRHHLIYGRRGVGKTALMVEAKRIVEQNGAATVWMNIQSVRNLDALGAFLNAAVRICDLPSILHSRRSSVPLSVKRASEVQASVEDQMSKRVYDKRAVSLLIPRMQNLLHILCQETSSDLFIFLDDVHYLDANQVPIFLDMMHGVCRDNPVWMKISAIKHQTRTFTDNPPVGLQSGHDASVIDLDITLEHPERAKTFLANIVKSYVETAGLTSISSFMASVALDRLVLASGGVPRDFMILTASAIQVARDRAHARLAGIQDVNEAAGKAAQTKLQELEDDAASSIGAAQQKIRALNAVREFLLEDRHTTFFRIDFKDKEDHPTEYGLMQSLMDLRMVHLINASLSDQHHAGRRSEVYMIDLSQYSGSRFKLHLLVLDFTRNSLVLKKTGSTETPRRGDTPRRYLGILRRGPIFDLTKLATA